MKSYSCILLDMDSNIDEVRFLQNGFVNETRKNESSNFLMSLK
jgi:hypothetical protein